MLVPFNISDSHPYEKSVYGTVLFADISGFTAMTAALMQSGKSGAENLSDIINTVFEPLIEAVYESGGDIISFAGDAFSAVFSDSLHSLYAAERIQKHFFYNPDVKYGENHFQLSVKVGICTDMYETGVAGDRINAWYIRGRAVNGSSDAEKLCQAGQTVICRQTYAGCSETVHAEKNGEYYRVLDFGSIKRVNKKIQKPEADPIDFWPEIIVKREFYNEFRTVCPVFISFQSPDSFSELNSFVTEMTNTAEFYGGYFNLLSFGDKGASALIVFGAPYAYENIAMRAVQFVHDLRLRTTVCFRSGITLGIVYAGLAGSEKRWCYTILGNEVNCSARMMIAAHWNEDYCSEKIRRGAQSNFSFKSLGTQKFKGYSDPIQVYAVQGVKTFELQQTGILRGRIEEIEKILEYIDSCSSELSYIQVYGEAGIGKSHLVDEIRQICSIRGIQWLTFRGDPIRQHSMISLKEFAACFFGKNSQEITRTDVQQKMAVFTNEDSDVQADLNNSIQFFEFLCGNNTAVSELSAKELSEGLQYSFGALFKTIAQSQILVIQLEDWHFFDEDSKILIHRALRGIDKNVAVIAVTRDPENFGNGREIAVNRISDINIIRIAEDLVQLPLSSELAAYIALKSEGNPFITGQIIHYLKENRLVEEQKGKQVICARQKIEIPDNINAVIASRVDRLSASLRKILKTAAVIGRSFPVQLLSAMIKTDKIGEKLRKIEQEDFWGPLSSLQYIFRHAIIRDVIYEMQLKRNLRLLHKNVAHIMEKLYPKMYDDLAFHYELAGIKEKTRKYLKKAAYQALHQYRNTDARRYFEKYFDYCRSDTERYQIQYECAALDDILGNIDQSVATLQIIIKSCRNLNTRADAHSLYGMLLNSAGDLEKAFEHYQQAEGLYRKKKNYTGILGVIGRQAGIYLNRCQHEQALEYINSAIKIASDENLEESYTGLMIQKASIFSSLGDNKNAQKLLDKIAKKSERYQRVYPSFCLTKGNILFNTGKYELSGNYYQKCLDHARKTGNKRIISYALGNRARNYWYEGEYERAISYYKADLNINLQIGDQMGIAIASGSLGGMYMDFGDYDKALFHFKTQQRICQNLQAWDSLAYIESQIAYLFMLQKDYAASESGFSKSHEICEKYKLSGIQSYNSYYTAMLFCRQRRFDEALFKTEEASSFFEKNACNDPFAFRSKLLMFRLRAQCGHIRAEEAEKHILEICDSETDKIKKAEASFELFHLTGAEKYRIAGVKQFTELYKDRPDGEFLEKKRILEEKIRNT